MQIFIREPLNSDAGEICKVIRQSINELCTVDHRDRPEILGPWLANKTPANISKWMGEPGSHMLVATISNQLAGVAAMTTDGFVTLNYVSPEHRFCGVSRCLLDHLIEIAETSRLAQVRLESTKTALRFYQSAGFSPVGAQTNPSVQCTPLAKTLIVRERISLA